LLLALMACTETSGAGSPPAVTSTALRPTVEQAQVDAYVHAVAAEQEREQANATLTAAYAAQTATAVTLQRTATAESARATATAQAIQATATTRAQDHQATATARAWEATATADAVHATATAVTAHQQATATAQAHRATATADAQAAAARATMTAAAWQLTATAETERQRAEAALHAEQVQQAQLETRRQRIVYPVKAYGPWVALLAFVTVLIWGGYRLIRAYEIRLRSVKRDARGDAPVLVFQQGKRIVAYDPDRSVGPATIFDTDVHQPQLTDPDTQERTTARDQTIDLGSRGLPQRTARRGVSQAKARQLLQQASQGPASTGPVRVVPPARIRPWLREVRPQALRHALTVEGEVLDDHQT
jgi:chemotaxis protein histidine kinase CheA